MTTKIDARGAAHRFRTMSVDGYAPGRNRPGYCLRWTYFAVMPGVQELTPLNNAVDVWNWCPDEHKHAIPANGIVPSGAVVVLGASTTRTDANAWKGDVYVSDGTFGGNPATDQGGSGIIGSTSHAARGIYTQRNILGYVTWMGGYPLIVGPSSQLPATPDAGQSKPTPKPVQEDNMALPVSIIPDAKSKTIYLQGVQGKTNIKSPYHLSLIKRAMVNTGGDKMLVAEMDIVKSYTRAVS